MTSPLTEPIDEWNLKWSSSFQTHSYEPIYLANGTFGGMLELSGSTMDLWSSRIGTLPVESDTPPAVLYPVTALRTQIYYRNEHYRQARVWVGSSGIHSEDPNYDSDFIPNIAQAYQCRQELDLRAGLATTSGKLCLGSQAALEAGLAPERVIPFETRVVFLKGSHLLGIEAVSGTDTDILFSPETILEERLVLDAAAKGIARLGTEKISCRIKLQQKILSVQAAGNRIEYQIQPNGGTPYRVVVTAQGAVVTTFNQRPALLARERALFMIEILPGEDCTETHPPSDFSDLLAEQRRRWDAFWAASDVRLPASEALWQQRYRASLFYVAQSMGNGAIHPGGLSKPMLPYWRGCFHDTDTYFCRPLLETGHADEAALHLAYRYRTLPKARGVARAAGRAGAFYPWQTDPEGGGDTLDVPINAAIIACEAWHHFLYTGRTTALIQSREIVSGTLANLADHLDLEAKPLRFHPKPLMTFSETMTAEDPTEVRMAIRAVAAAYLAATRAPNDPSPEFGVLAQRILDELTLPLLPDGSYAFSTNGEPDYLRCPSVTLGSFPLHNLPANQVMARTFEKELSKIMLLFAWLPHHASIVASQLMRRDGPTSAVELLRQTEVFYKPWHAFDEWENRRSVRAAIFVTGAGGFCVALHHLLLAEVEGGAWRILPGTPSEWRDLSFRDLHTRAGWKISARIESGQLVSLAAAPAHEHATETLGNSLPFTRSYRPRWVLPGIHE